MLKETETEETIVFFVTFLSMTAFQLGGGGPPGPPWLRSWYVVKFEKVITIYGIWKHFHALSNLDLNEIHYFYA